MPLQNRVTPEGSIVASPERGSLMGNRGGRLHDQERRLSSRRWVSKQWISCRLSFNGRRRQVMAPNRYTELFFLDEATALAAGHRPCFECRRNDALLFAEHWAHATNVEARPTARQMDEILHRERLDAHAGKRLWRSALADLPEATMVRYEGGAHLVLGTTLRPWTLAGYLSPIPRPTGFIIDVLTPPSIVAVIAAGYGPMLHASAAAG